MTACLQWNLFEALPLCRAYPVALRFSRLILEFPQAGEDLPIRRKRKAEPRPDRRRLRPQKRVAGFLSANRCWQSWLSRRAAGFDRLCTRRKGLVFGLDRQCKAGVGEGVFVTAVDLGFIGQASNFLQRRKHQLGIAFKDAPATQGKQRVAGKDGFQVRKIIADMPKGMPGCFQNLHLMTIELELGAFADRLRQAWNAIRLSFRANDLAMIAGLERKASGGVVIVVMSDENAPELPSVGVQRCRDGFRCRCIDDDRFTALLRVQQDAIIVGETGDEYDFCGRHDNSFGSSAHSVKGYFRRRARLSQVRASTVATLSNAAFTMAMETVAFYTAGLGVVSNSVSNLRAGQINFR
jgi:hypothetical protein